jgi:hypothetical protein
LDFGQSPTSPTTSPTKIAGKNIAPIILNRSQ